MLLALLCTNYLYTHVFIVDIHTYKCNYIVSQNLSSAADIIAQGTKRMETAVQERVDQQLRQGGQKLEDFHSELIGLRQRWKLKKTGSSIMGDLTYRSGL